MERKISYLKMYAGNGGSGGRAGKEGGKQPVANDLSVLLYQLWDTRSCLGEVRGNLGMWLSVAGIGRYRIPPDPLFSQVVYSEVLPGHKWSTTTCSPVMLGRQRVAPRSWLVYNKLLPQQSQHCTKYPIWILEYKVISGKHVYWTMLMKSPIRLFLNRLIPRKSALSNFVS